MSEWAASGSLVAAGTAFWLGVLTSVSPCPLASNIAAISYLGKGLAHPRRVFAAGLLYTLGRVLTYALLGWLLAASLATVVGLSNGLQRVMNQLIGPVLILAGMLLLELIRWNRAAPGLTAGLYQRVGNQGLGGAVVLGAVFALSFCPVSAALFFGSLIPLAMASGGSLVLPSLYGVGTGMPVLAFAAVVGFGAQALNRSFQRVAQLEVWARRVTGIIFVAVGLYYSLNYIFEAFD